MEIQGGNGTAEKAAAEPSGPERKRAEAATGSWVYERWSGALFRGAKRVAVIG